MTDRLTELQEAAGYDPEGDTGIDSLIDYKNALEDAYSLDADALDELNLLLSAPEWPGASGMEDVAVIVRKTGRVEIENAPEWARH